MWDFNHWGEAKWPTAFLKYYISTPVYLKLGCKSKFVSCLEKNINLVHGRTRDRPFFSKGPLKLALQGPFEAPFGGS